MLLFNGFNKRLSARTLAAAGFLAVMPMHAAFAQTIVVQGTQRVDADTIRSYFRGGDQGRINEAVKELYATGLFSDVRVTRDGGRIVVRVVENQSINRVAFEGNSRLKSATLSREVQSKSRGAYNQATVDADVQRLRDVYRRAGRGDAKITARTVPLENGRMDVVFTIDEAGKTGVRTINFTGNAAYSDYRLRNLMETTQMNFMSWFKDSDIYDPDRISADLERIRRFYLKNGYADFRVVGNDARYDEAERGWIVNITVEEGAPYTISSVNVDSRIPDVPAETLIARARISAGDRYDGDKVEKAVQELTREVARKGYAFAAARPQADKNAANGTVALSFVVEEGPRVYVERIIVRGNTRTRDYVIRREFDMGEGDAYNRVLVDRAEKRLNNLGFFKTVRISNQPGSSPDRVVVIVDVEDKPTGSFGVSGGYSTVDGFIAEVSVSEANFMGRGQFAKAAVTYGQRTRGLDLSFTEPYFMGYRMSAGLDLFARETRNSRYSVYESTTVGGTIRFGIPITEEFSVGLRYSLYSSEIRIPNDARRPYNDCTVPIPGLTPPIDPVGGNATVQGPLSTNTYSCVTNGEASLAIKEAQGQRLVSMPGVSLIYNTLDNNRNPTSGFYGELRGDIAGLGGDAKFAKGTGDLRYFYPIWDDVVGFVRLQGGHVQALGGDKLRIMDNFNIGSSLVRGFAPNGLGTRDISPGMYNRSAGLGGTTYFGATAEVQFPIFGLPKEVGLKGALFADAGTLFGYAGRTNFAELAGYAPGTPCVAMTAKQNAVGTYYTQGGCVTVHDSHAIRSSVGVGLLWQSPLGPIRFDYAWVLSKDKYDVKQAFRFTGGGTF